MFKILSSSIWCIEYIYYLQSFTFKKNKNTQVEVIEYSTYMYFNLQGTVPIREQLELSTGLNTRLEVASNYNNIINILIFKTHFNTTLFDNAWCDHSRKKSHHKWQTVSTESGSTSFSLNEKLTYYWLKIKPKGNISIIDKRERKELIHSTFQ